MKMDFRSRRFPPGILHQPADELLLSINQIDHPALIVTDERNGSHISHGDRIGDLEFAIAQIRAAGSNNEGKIVRDVEMLPMVHAHADEQLSIRVWFEWTTEIMIFKEEPDGSPLVWCRISVVDEMSRI